MLPPLKLLGAGGWPPGPHFPAPFYSTGSVDSTSKLIGITPVVMTSSHGRF